MMLTQLIFGITGGLLFAMGLRSALIRESILARILAVNVSGAGIFLAFVAIPYRVLEETPDPVPHALVLTRIVVAVSATALAHALRRRLE